MSTREAPVLKLAPPYDDGLVCRIEQGFTDMLGFEVRFRVEEDPALLCGFVAYIQGTVYDVSGKTQLAGIREHLLQAAITPPPLPAEEVDA